MSTRAEQLEEWRWENVQKHLEFVDTTIKSQVGQFASCWNWTGRCEGGYGRHAYRTDGGVKIAQVHRFVYERFCGAVPPGMIVRHLCANRACCNPAHLRIGTHKENAADYQLMRKEMS